MSSSDLVPIGRGPPPQLEASLIPPLEPDDRVDLRELGRKLWRRKGVILGTAASAMVLAVLIIFQLTPTYRATAFVMIDPRQSKVVNLQEVLSGLPSDTETIRSEMLVIRSRELARRTIDKLHLDRDPSFAKELRQNPWADLFDLRGWLPGEWADTLLGPRQPEPVSTQDLIDMRQSSIVDEFLQRLTVNPEAHSRVLSIGFDSTSPRIAANVVNTLVDFYIVAQMEAKFEATKRANAWLSEHLSGLREQVQNSERAVESFRQRAGLVRGKDATVAHQEVSEINTQLVQAQADRAAAEAKLRQLQGALGKPEAVGSISQVLQSPLIQRLREQQAELERRAAEMSNQYGESYPAMANMHAEIANLQKKIDTEIGKIIQSVRNDVVVARAREEAIAARLNESKAQVGRMDAAEVHLHGLEREAEANRTLYENFLNRFKETSSEAEGLEQPDARIVSRADVPARPVFPRKDIALPLALFISLVAGIGFGFAVERLDSGFRSMDEVEDIMGVPALGLIPAFKGPSRRRRQDQAFVLEQRGTAFAEAIRSLSTKLLLIDRDRAPKTILVASSLPQEGKTMVVLSLAYLHASFGHKVAVVDCDLRKPAAHIELVVPLRPGLVDFLAGEATLAEVMHKDPRFAIDVIPAGDETRNPAGLLASDNMKTLLTTLALSHDLVILDSSPLLSVSDTLALARLADKTVFLVRWAESRRALALRGLRSLVEAGAKMAGGLLSRVDVKKHAHYGYGDSGLYYGRVTEYYRRSAQPPR
jgi:capsular exopolysaccharide synthesis family protein